MREHPTISVNISMDQAWCRSKHPPRIAKNVVAIADTDAQTNVWSLLSYLFMFFIAESIQSFSGIIFYAPKIGDVSSIMNSVQHRNIQTYGAPFGKILFILLHLFFELIYDKISSNYPKYIFDI